MLMRGLAAPSQAALSPPKRPFWELAFARLLFHSPAFALLDEATTALDIASEAELVQLCLARGVTLVTVAHRPSLVRFHRQLLRVHGEGRWEHQRLDTAASTTRVV